MSLWLWALSWLSLWQEFSAATRVAVLPRMTSWTTPTDVNMRVQYPVLLASQHYTVEPVAAVLAATTVAVPSMTRWTTAADVKMHVQYPILLASQH